MSALDDLEAIRKACDRMEASACAREFECERLRADVASWAILETVVGVILGAIVMAIIMLISSHAHAGERWRQAQAERWRQAQAEGAPACDEACQRISAWVRDLKQPDNPHVSCCGEADRYEADLWDRDGDHYVAIITDGHGVVPNGTHIEVPNPKIKWDAGNPTGRGQLFLAAPDADGNRHVYCFVPGGGV